MLAWSMERVARGARRLGVALGKPVVVRHPREIALLDELVQWEQQQLQALQAARAKKASGVFEQLGLKNGYTKGRVERRPDGSYVIHKG